MSNDISSSNYQFYRINMISLCVRVYFNISSIANKFVFPNYKKNLDGTQKLTHYAVLMGIELIP